MIDEVGGPALGSPPQLLALLTSIRLAFRFRYEVFKHFSNDFNELSEDERRVLIEEIPRRFENITSESNARGNTTSQDLLEAFDDDEGLRIERLVSNWSTFKRDLYEALGLSIDGKLVSDQGLTGPYLEQYQLAFDSMKMVNAEFLSRCCARISRKMTRSDEELRQGAESIEKNLKILGSGASPLLE